MPAILGHPIKTEGPGTIQLCCPDDQGSLSLDMHGATCSRCGRIFTYRNTILELLPKETLEQHSTEGIQRACYCQTFSKRRDRLLYRVAGSAIEILGNWFLYSWAARTVAKLAGTRSLCVLDAACGHGMLRRYLAPQHQYTGIDFSVRPLSRAQRIGRETYVLGDLSHLPFREAIFDVVVSLQAFQYLRRPEIAIQQLQRVLKAGGTLLLSVPNRHSVKYRLQGIPSVQVREFDREGLSELLSSSFDIKKVEARGFWIPVPRVGVHVPGTYPEGYALAWTAEARKQ